MASFQLAQPHSEREPTIVSVNAVINSQRYLVNYYNICKLSVMSVQTDRQNSRTPHLYESHWGSPNNNPQALTNNPHYIKWSVTLDQPVICLQRGCLVCKNIIIILVCYRGICF